MNATVSMMSDYQEFLLDHLDEARGIGFTAGLGVLLAAWAFSKRVQSLVARSIVRGLIAGVLFSPAPLMGAGHGPVWVQAWLMLLISLPNHYGLMLVSLFCILAMSLIVFLGQWFMNRNVPKTPP